jgi:hypothetical protein
MSNSPSPSFSQMLQYLPYIASYQNLSSPLHVSANIQFKFPTFTINQQAHNYCIVSSDAQSTYIYRAPQCMSPRWNWDSPTPLAASECALPPVPKGGGGGAHSPGDDWRNA